MPRIDVYEDTGSASVEAADLDEVNSQITRLGRRPDAKKRRGTYEVELGKWTMPGLDVRVGMSGDTSD
jgi:hypothetical protein